MTVTKDPEQNELKALLAYAGELAGKRVLEIGAGYGRLTWRYAAKASEVVGIDPDLDKITRGLKEMPQALRGRVTLLESTLEQYQRAGLVARFDVALMSWAL